MHNQDLPAPAMLRKLLTYDPDTGLLYWRTRTPDMFAAGKQTAGHVCARWNACHAGTEAFTSVSNKGYKQGAILGKHALGHRVIWALTNGRWPDDNIDHINGVKSDNRLVNLRDVPQSVNMRNAVKRADNTSGICGVSWNKKGQKWVARIGRGGDQTFLGLFDNLEEATAARKAAEVGHGYTARHGQ